jgi:membrane dipeptidase
MNTQEKAFYDKAVRLAHQYIIADGHIDLPWRLSLSNYRADGDNRDMPISSDEGDFDYKRAKEGGLSAPFMAVYIPASFQDDLASAKVEADTLIDMIHGIIAAHPDKFAKGDSPAQIEKNFSQGLISLPIGLENGAPVMHLHDVQYFFDRGVRYITLTHSKDNHICDSSYDSSHTWGGLSPFGKDLIAEMNKIGMIIDVSHVSDQAFYQVMKLSDAPVLATHSSCRSFTPGWERNMDDDMIRLLARKDGAILINFGTDFLDGGIAAKRKVFRTELDQRLSVAGLKAEEPAAKEIIGEVKAKHPGIYADVSHVADHIDHVRKIAGIDHIGIGSDFDGLGDSLPTGLKDVSQYPNLIAELLKRGYSDEDIEKICYLNVWRVWSKVNELAMSI